MVRTSWSCVGDDPLGDREIAEVARARAHLELLAGRLEEDPHGVDDAAVIPPDAHLRSAGVPLLFVSALVVPGLHALALELCVDGREDLVVAEQRELDRGVVVARALVVEVVRPSASVVAIDEEVRPPLGDEVLHVGLDRRVLELHIVTIEIDSPRVATLPSLRAFEPVRVDLRRDEDRHLVQERVGRGAGSCEIPHEHEQALTEGAFTAMYVGRKEDDRAVQRHRLPRLRDQWAGEDRVGELPALTGLTISPEAHIRGTATELLEVVPHLEVSRVRREAVHLSGGARVALRDRAPLDLGLE